MTDLTQLESLRVSLEAELRDGSGHRSSQASDESLAWAIEKVREAESLLGCDRANAVQRIGEVARKAVDSWSLTASVTEQATALAQRLKGMGR